MHVFTQIFGRCIISLHVYRLITAKNDRHHHSCTSLVLLFTPSVSLSLSFQSQSTVILHCISVNEQPILSHTNMQFSKRLILSIFFGNDNGLSIKLKLSIKFNSMRNVISRIIFRTAHSLSTNTFGEQTNDQKKNDGIK